MSHINQALAKHIIGSLIGQPVRIKINQGTRGIAPSMGVGAAPLLELDPTHAKAEPTQTIKASIDWSKPVRTVQGHLPVEVLTTKGRCKEGRNVAIVYIDTETMPRHIELDGSVRGDVRPYGGIKVTQLENVPEEYVRYYNVYANRKTKELRLGQPTATSAEADAQWNNDSWTRVGRVSFDLMSAVGEYHK